MVLRSLSLQHFRSHHTFQFDFSESIGLIVGPNGSGKSSILEAIHLFSIGKSIRALQTSEMISLGKELARVKITGEVDEHAAETNSEENDQIGAEAIELEAMITRGEVGGRRTSGKLWSVNGVRRAGRSTVGVLKSVLFRPEDMRLIEGSPARRRDFLNGPLTQLYREYASSLDAYDKHLTRRNRLLQAVREGEQPRTVLTYWNEGLLKHGQIIQHFRQQFFTSLPLLQVDLPFTAVYLPSVMSAERQQQYLEKEIAAGHTLIGPHKDDFDVILPLEWLPPAAGQHSTEQSDPPLSVMIYGSRGQQRLAVLWLKLCEAAYLHSISGDKPLLLLDDILSELDEQSRLRIVQLAEEYQTILTTIDEVEVHKLFPVSQMIRLSVHR